jgi:HD-GYP domain-containing protein (c-di-GMP phosphodiesterase class II)
MGCGADQVRSVHQVSLLRFLGCTADSSETARGAGGDDITFNSAMAPVLFDRRITMLRGYAKALGAGQPPAKRARLRAEAVTGGFGDPAAHCEVASMLGRRLGMSGEVLHALGHAYERWDGNGSPSGLAGEEVPLEIRVTMVARDVDLLREHTDVTEILRRRRGKAYDPQVVDAYSRVAPGPQEAEWDEVIDVEPEPVAEVDDLDQALRVLADFGDVKSPWTRGHSTRVSSLVGSAARVAGLDEADSRELERAGLVHDIGRVGVENGVWDKRGPLSTDEWEKARLHPYHTQRVLSRCRALAALGDLASSHHERLDGSGYHRQLSGHHISVGARLLAAADALVALTSSRPHRSALSIEEARRVLNDDVAAGRLDPRAVASVVTAAMGDDSPQRIPNPGGLTDRELEVLRLLAAGHSNRQMGETLFISHKTVGRHVENIYAKINVSTRAGATVFAMEHRLMG